MASSLEMSEKIPRVLRTRKNPHHEAMVPATRWTEDIVSVAGNQKMQVASCSLQIQIQIVYSQ